MLTQVIPAENIIAAFQNSQKTVFAISDNASEAQTFLEVYKYEKGCNRLVWLTFVSVLTLLTVATFEFYRHLSMV